MTGVQTCALPISWMSIPGATNTTYIRPAITTPGNYLYRFAVSERSNINVSSCAIVSNIIAIGVNAEKKYMFSLEERKRFIEETFRDEPSVYVITYEGLTIDLCKKHHAAFILRGLRNPADFEFEKAIAHTNRRLSKIETIFLLTAASTSFISSSIVRDVIRNG